MGWFFALFTLGTYAFYLPIMVMLCFLWFFFHAFEEDDKIATGPSSVALIVVSLMYAIFGDVNVYAWIWGNKLMTLVYAGGYFFIGFIVAVVMYGFRSRHFRTEKLPEYNRLYNEYIQGLDKHSVMENDYLKIEDFVRQRHSRKDARMFSLDAYRSWIIYWIGFYPIGLTYKFVVKGIRGFVSWLYDHILKGAFKKIHSKVAAHTEYIDTEAAEMVEAKRRELTPAPPAQN